MNTRYLLSHPESDDLFEEHLTQEEFEEIMKEGYLLDVTNDPYWEEKFMKAKHDEEMARRSEIDLSR